MCVELRDVRVLDDLSISDLLRTPENEPAVQTPLGMHDMEETMRVLTLNRYDYWSRIYVQITLVVE